MSSDWNKNPDGCEDADAHFAYTVVSDLNICGCGYHDAYVAETLAVLRACPLYEGRWTPDPGFGELGAELLLHVMDHAGLIEHGTSVSGAWITERGTRFLAIMQDKPIEWLDAAPGYSCSGCPDVAASR